MSSAELAKIYLLNPDITEQGILNIMKTANTFNITVLELLNHVDIEWFEHEMFSTWKSVIHSAVSTRSQRIRKWDNYEKTNRL
jgi:hypothetical protein